ARGLGVLKIPPHLVEAHRRKGHVIAIKLPQGGMIRVQSSTCARGPEQNTARLASCHCVNMCQAQLLDEIRLVGIEAGNARSAENSVRIYRESEERYKAEGCRRSGE